MGEERGNFGGILLSKASYDKNVMCTKLKITDIEVREIYWKEFIQQYKPEF